MEEPEVKREPKGDKPERSIDAPGIVWWMLAVLAILAFAGLAYLLGRAG